MPQPEMQFANDFGTLERASYAELRRMKNATTDEYDSLKIRKAIVCRLGQHPCGGWAGRFDFTE